MHSPMPHVRIPVCRERTHNPLMSPLYSLAQQKIFPETVQSITIKNITQNYQKFRKQQQNQSQMFDFNKIYFTHPHRNLLLYNDRM